MRKSYSNLFKVECLVGYYYTTYVLISIGEMAGTISKLWSATGCEDFASFICIKMVAIKAMDLKNVKKLKWKEKR